MFADKHPKTAGAAVLALAVAVVVAVPAARAGKPGGAAPVYAYNELSGVESDAFALNNPDAAGTLLIGGTVYSQAVGTPDAAVLWQADAVTGTALAAASLTLPTRASAHVQAVNDTGIAVGGASTPLGFVAVPGVGAQYLPGQCQVAYGINNLGDIVGWWTTDAEGNRHGGLWHVDAQGTVTGPIDLGSFLPKGINDHGLMCGQKDGRPAIAWFDANGVLQGAYLSAAQGWGTALNNLGDVVGGRTLWRTATGQTIDLGGGDAYGINDHGQVVGAITDRAGNPRAYLWQNGQMADLNTLVALPADGVKRTLTMAFGINNTGHIAGRVELAVKRQTVGHGYLLTPQP